MEPLFIDVHPLSCCATDHALETIFKAHHDHDTDIWQPHESVLIRRMAELFTQRGHDRLEAVRKQILSWESGANYKDASKPVPKPGYMERWGKDELSLVKLYLESLFPGDWTLDDHMLCLEYVFQRYLPADELRTEAEWLATKSSLMGKVQANLAEQATAKQADLLLAALPSNVADATAAVMLTAIQQAQLQYGAARCAENVRALADDVRHKMRQTIMEHTEQKMLGGEAPIAGLEQKLFDSFAVLNRDWRRIAITEAGNNQTVGFIAAQKPGTKVKRVEQYANACAFCRSIDGKVMTVVSPDHPYKDGKTSVWVGKDNIGRSASPMKRVGLGLVERTEAERYWLPAGLAHPHCRGRWVPVVEAAEGEDPAFAEWVRGVLAS